jgi:hypothetical protein
MNFIFNPEVTEATERPQGKAGADRANESFRAVARVGRVIPNAPLQDAFARRIIYPPLAAPEATRDNPRCLEMTARATHG